MNTNDGYVEDGFGPPWPLNYSDWHPLLRDKICSCSGGIYKFHPYGYKYNPVKKMSLCAKCTKPGWQYLKYCHVCYEFFIKCFQHPAYKSEDSICWHCLEAVYPNDINTNLPSGLIVLEKSLPTINTYRISLELPEASFNPVASFV
jgi:hypothetical protein